MALHPPQVSPTGSQALGPSLPCSAGLRWAPLPVRVRALRAHPQLLWVVLEPCQLPRNLLGLGTHVSGFFVL